MNRSFDNAQAMYDNRLPQDYWEDKADDDLTEDELDRLGDDGPGYNWVENWRI